MRIKVKAAPYAVICFLFLLALPCPIVSGFGTKADPPTPEIIANTPTAEVFPLPPEDYEAIKVCNLSKFLCNFEKLERWGKYPANFSFVITEEYFGNGNGEYVIYAFGLQINLAQDLSLAKALDVIEFSVKEDLNIRNWPTPEGKIPNDVLIPLPISSPPLGFQ